MGGGRKRHGRRDRDVYVSPLTYTVPDLSLVPLGRSPLSGAARGGPESIGLTNVAVLLIALRVGLVGVRME